MNRTRYEALRGLRGHSAEYLAAQPGAGENRPGALRADGAPPPRAEWDWEFSPRAPGRGRAAQPHSAATARLLKEVGACNTRHAQAWGFPTCPVCRHRQGGVYQC
jgi:hypothetical protein